MVVKSQKPIRGLKLQLPLHQLNINSRTALSKNPPIQALTPAAAVPGEPEEPAIDPMAEFEKLSVLGCGRYGVVHKVIRKKTSSTTYALKTIQDHHHINNMVVSQEVEILKSTDSPYLVKCYDVFEAKPGEKAILMEYMDEGALDTIVKKVGPLPETLIANIAKQVLYGLNYLHESNIVHLDIKPANLLVNNKMEVKIGDFGVSRIVGTDGYNEENSCQAGTYAYMSPERLDSQTYTNHNVYAGDVWSLGVSLWELYVGHFLFFPPENKPPSWMDIVLVVCCGEFPSFPDHASQDFINFLACCLERDASKRWTASQLLQHPFVCNSHHDESDVPPLESIDIPRQHSVSLIPAV